MPTREIAPIGAPCWIELSSSDTQRATEFYAQLFGWATDASDDYTTCTVSGSTVAGIVDKPTEMDASARWITYFASANAQATVELADESGGQSAVPPKEVGSLGTSALLVDPGGATAGVWQPGEHPGYQLFGEPGTAVWHELATGDYHTSVLFYEIVFGWSTKVESDSPEFQYTTAEFDGEPLAGIFEAGESGSATWDVYFGTDDVDRTVELAKSLGGRVTEAPTDSPYGRYAGLADPTGAEFKVMTPSDWAREPLSAS